MISATILGRPNVSCSRALRSVSVEIAVTTPLHGHTALGPALLLFDCAYIERAFGVTHEEMRAGASARQPLPAVSPRTVPAQANRTAPVDGTAPADHRHTVTAIYNFE